MNLFETMREIAQTEIHKLQLSTFGVVTAIFPHSKASDKDNYECNVRLKNSDVELRKVPIATQCIGLVGIPRVGDQLIIDFINGDMNSPVAIGRLYNDEDRPPLNDAEEMIYVPPRTHTKTNPKARRFYLEFPKGVIFKITDNVVDIKAGGTKITVANNGDVTIESKANVKVKADGDANLESTGHMSISGKSVWIESTDKVDGIVDIKGRELAFISQEGAALVSEKGSNTISSKTYTALVADENIEIKTTADNFILLKGDDTTIKTGKALQISAKTATIKSDATMDIMASAKMAIKGQIVTIN